MIEAAVLAPVLLVIVLVLVLVGRVASAGNDIEAAARDAARGASQQRSPAAAQVEAQRIATASLAEAGVTCAAVAVTVDTSAFAPGGRVAADVVCDLAVRDLTPLRIGGTKTISARAVSVIDTHRGAGP